MDMTREEYIDFVNHLFLERMVDEGFIESYLANPEGQEGAGTVDAMTVIE